MRRELLLQWAMMPTDVCDLEFHNLEAISPEARTLREGWCANRGNFTSLAVCFDNEQRALEIAGQFLPFLKASDVRPALRTAGNSAFRLRYLVS